MVQPIAKSWLWGVLVAVALVGHGARAVWRGALPGGGAVGGATGRAHGGGDRVGFPGRDHPAGERDRHAGPRLGHRHLGDDRPQPASNCSSPARGASAFQVPTSIAVTTPTAYRVSIAGTTDTGTAFASTAPVTFTVNPPAQIVSLTPASPAKGATTAMQIVTRYTDFAAGATVASFGAGASVGGGPEGGFGPITVTSATTATALVAMNANAAAGARAVTVATGVQTATLAQGVTVAETRRREPGAAHHIHARDGGHGAAALPYQATATDADNDTLAWALTAAPSGMTIVPATGAIAWTPPAALTGTHTVALQVTDGKGGLDTQSYSIVVAAAHVNQPPHITTTPGTTATAGQAYSYAPAATDADGDTLTWSLTQSPAGMADRRGHRARSPGRRRRRRWARRWWRSRSATGTAEPTARRSRLRWRGRRTGRRASRRAP